MSFHYHTNLEIFRRGIIREKFYFSDHEAIRMSKRVEYIDIAKGIGILLVVMGHNDFGLVSPFFYKFIYSFHMPLFFFVSGMFFKSSLPFFSLIQRRFDSVLKPYIATIILIFLMTLSFTKVNFDVAIMRLIKAGYANGHYIDWVQLWFLPHLFALNIFSYGYYRLAGLLHFKWKNWFLLPIILLLGISTIGLFWPFTFRIADHHFTLFGLPLSFDLILVSGFYFVLGSEVNKKIPDKFFDHPAALLGSVACLVGMIMYFPETIDFNTRFYQSWAVNTAEALLGIIFILAISKQIARFSRVSSALRYIGQSSLIILIFHVPIQETWGEKILNISNNQDFSYWIAYLAGVAFPLLINHYLIGPNPKIRTWFGQPGKSTESMVDPVPNSQKINQPASD